MKLNPLAVMGSRVMNLTQLRTVFRKDLKDEFYTLLNFGDGKIDVLGYQGAGERDKNFKRIESWLLEYDSFLTIVDLIINLDHFCYAMSKDDTSLALFMDGVKDAIIIPFTNKADKDAAWKELEGLTHDAKRRR